jgi:hypothetical protein
MRIGMAVNYAGGFAETVAELGDYEKAGLDIVFVPEAYTFDAVSQLGFIAARTQRMEIASGILQLYTRTPTMTAMTAAGLDYVSGGRFTLGIGASGPQVIEGWHGVPYDAPVGRTREIIEICRTVWRRERLEHAGSHYTIPLPAGRGTGLGKALKLINRPVGKDPDRGGGARPKAWSSPRSWPRAGADLLLPGEGGAWGPRWRRAGRGGTPRRAAGRGGAGAAGHRRGRGRVPGAGPADRRAVHRRHGPAPGPGPQLLL